MAGVNKVILVGHLGKDPEVRSLENGAKVANFSLATTESYKDKNTGERIDNTEWHNIVVWRGLADVAERFLKKGSLVYIEGKLQTRSYEKDGVTRYSTDIQARELTMLGKKGDNPGAQGGGNYNAPQQAQAPSTPAAPSTPSTPQAFESNTSDADDDLPF
jgi:single-strand DNA-binding protein